MNMPDKTFIDVAVPLPVDRTFTYRIPCSLSDKIEIGKRVLVPFGKRIITGFCIGFRESHEVNGIKDIREVVDDEPIFDEKRIKLFQWISSYYFAPIGEVLSLACPAGMVKEKTETFVSRIQNPKSEIPNLNNAPVQARIFGRLSENGDASLKSLRKEFGSIDSAVKKLEQKGLISLIQRKANRDPLEDIAPQTISHKPTDEQGRAINAISHALKANIFSPFLLYGVTGSGKTLVYLKAIEHAVSLGRQAIFLVPEISLAPWPAKYLKAIFPGRVAVLHSGLSDGERHDEWKRIKGGAVDVVVGARSALFSPLKNLGLVIVDEEHEPSYKQEEGVRYNARDVSLMMGRMLNLTVVLGSATPSVETFFNAKNGKIKEIHLTRRVESRQMPVIEMADMRNRSQKSEVRSQKDSGIISERLKGLMGKNQELGYQTILFLNRRGFSNFLVCETCGHTFSCLNCSVSLTMHKSPHPPFSKGGQGGILKCHYCDVSLPIPDACPECRGSQIKLIGIGTEKLEEEVRKILPRARVARMDRDTTRKKRSHERIVDAVDRGDVDVLVGTQMVAKGHHFPNVTLVGIVSADTSINIPDFRSSERTFQLITQAAGRGGRGEVPGEVVVQTLNPEHFCLRKAAEHDYEGFFEKELSNRKELLYPPFSRLINLRFEGNREKDVESAAETARMLSENLLKKGGKRDVDVLGPAPCFLSKLKGKYRHHMLLKGRYVKPLHEFARNIVKGFEEKKYKGVRLVIDVDPSNTL